MWVENNVTKTKQNFRSRLEKLEVKSNNQFGKFFINDDTGCSNIQVCTNRRLLSQIKFQPRTTHNFFVAIITIWTFLLLVRKENFINFSQKETQFVKLDQCRDNHSL